MARPSCIHFWHCLASSAEGPIGILVGPMLVAFLQALLNMLNKELHLLGKEADTKGTPVVFATKDGPKTSETQSAKN